MNDAFFARGMIKNINASQFKKNTIALLGDSITYANLMTWDAPYNMGRLGYFTWANILLGQRLKLVGNYGVSGETSEQVYLRVDDVINKKPSYCIVLAGTNDIGGTWNPDTINNLGKIYDKLANAGITVIACTLTPRNEIYSGLSENVLKINRYIREQVYKRNNFILCDWYEDIVDYSTGLPKAGYLYDGLHPSPLGAYTLGNRLYLLLKDKIPSASVFSGSNMFTENKIANGYMFGDDGTGKVPEWGVASGTATFRKVLRTDISGLYWQEIETTTANNVEIYQVKNIPSDLSIGDTVSAYVEYEIDNSATSVTDINALIMCNGSGYSSSAISIGNPLLTPPHKGILYTPPLTIPEGTTMVLPKISCNLKGKFRIGRCALYKT